MRRTYRSITPYTSSGFRLVSLTSATTTSVSIPFLSDWSVGWVSHGIGSFAGWVDGILSATRRCSHVWLFVSLSFAKLKTTMRGQAKEEEE